MPAFLGFLIKKDRNRILVGQEIAEELDLLVQIFKRHFPLRHSDKRTDIQCANSRMHAHMPVQIDPFKRLVGQFVQKVKDYFSFAAERGNRAIVIDVGLQKMNPNRRSLQNIAELAQEILVSSERPVRDSQNAHYMPTML